MLVECKKMPITRFSEAELPFHVNSLYEGTSVLLEEFDLPLIMFWRNGGLYDCKRNKSIEVDSDNNFNIPYEGKNRKLAKNKVYNYYFKSPWSPYGKYPDCKFYHLKPLGLSNYYLLDNGQIFSSATMEYLTPSIHSSGYYRVKLVDDNNKCKDFFIHRLVAFNLLSNPNDYHYVNHIDRDRTNNAVTNLQLVARQRDVAAPVDNSINLSLVADPYVHEICKMLKKHEEDRFISHNTGVDLDAIKGIRTRRIYTRISEQYDF